MTKATLLASICFACLACTFGQNLGAVNSVGVISDEPTTVIQCHADVVFCVDNSGSIRDSNQNGVDNWALMLNFIQALINQINVGPDNAHVGLVDFGNRAHLDFDLNGVNGNDSEATVDYSVANLQYRGENTNTTGGLYWSRMVLTNASYGARPNVTKVIILLTDGKPTYDADLLPAEVATIKSLGIRIVCIGISDAINETLLKSIASTPEDYVYGGDFSGLDQVKDTVINNETCQPVQLTTPTPPTTKAMLTAAAAATSTPTTTATPTTTVSTTITPTTITPTTTTPTTTTPTTTTPTTTTPTTTTPTTTTPTTTTPTTTTPTTTMPTTTTATTKPSSSMTPSPWWGTQNPEAISQQQGCQPSADVVFILDTTGVNEQTDLTVIREFLVSLINNIDMKGQITAGFLTFSSNNIQPTVNVNEYTERFEIAVNSRTLIFAAGAINACADCAKQTSTGPNASAAPTTAGAPARTSAHHASGTPASVQVAPTVGGAPSDDTAANTSSTAVTIGGAPSDDTANTSGTAVTQAPLTQSSQAGGAPASTLHDCAQHAAATPAPTPSNTPAVTPTVNSTSTQATTQTISYSAVPTSSQAPNNSNGMPTASTILNALNITQAENTEAAPTTTAAINGTSTVHVMRAEP